MSGAKSRFVVSADWVEQQLGTNGFRIIDAAWYLPAHGRNGAAEYAEGHIPGAVFFDQDVIADHTTGQILAEFALDPTRGYQRKTDEPPKPGVHPFTMS